MRRTHLRKFLNVSALLLIATLSFGSVSTDRLKTVVTWLADPAREGRHAGSKGAAAAAEYIAKQMLDMGYTAQMQEFGGNRRNVVGHWGTPYKYIVIGAHY